MYKKFQCKILSTTICASYSRNKSILYIERSSSFMFELEVCTFEKKIPIYVAKFDINRKVKTQHEEKVESRLHLPRSILHS